MRNDSKSGLSMNELFITISAFVIVSTSTQLLVSSKIQNNENKETRIAATATEEMIKELSTNEGTRITQETRIAATSRSSITRGEATSTEIVQNQVKKEESKKQEQKKEEKSYISISQIKISKNMDLTKRCGISKSDFKKLMKNTKKDTKKFFYKHSDIIYDLCEKYQLNEIFFCGLIAGESGWNIVQSHRETCNYISMMNDGKLIEYKTPEEGLEAAAKLLHNKYLKKSGKFYQGKTLSSIQKNFCPKSSDWVDLIYSCMEQII